MSALLLNVEELSVSFDGFKALDISSFELDLNELRVVIGPNGAGKTTFLDVLCGKTKPDTGKALMLGQDLTKISEQQIVELGVGRKFQTPTVFGSLPVFDNLFLAHKARKGVFTTLFSKATPAIRQNIQDIAHRVGLDQHLEQKAAYLSHGQKQWLEIGMLIIQAPKLLLIDEPAAGMTDEETVKTGELLLELSRDHSIIVIEHDMEFVKQLQSKVTVLCEGKVLTHGTLEEVQSNPLVIERYLGRGKGPQADSQTPIILNSH